MSTEKELVTLTQIAIRAGVSASAVSNWRKRYADFPQPVDGDRFAAVDVNIWLRSHDKSTPEPQSSISRMPINMAVDRSIGHGLSRVESLTAIATIVTLVALGADLASDTPDVTAVAAKMETDRQLPPGCLTRPVEPLRRVDSAVAGLLASTVTAALADSSAAGVFDDLLARMADREAAAAESLTNTRAIDFLTALLPDQAESVLDPACGSGGLLQAAAAATGATQLSGYDTDPQAWALCVQRLLLHDQPVDQIHHQDVFTASPTGFDLVVAHPPFGMRPTPDSTAGQFLINAGTRPSGAGDFAWLLTARNALTEGGTALVLTTAGPTFQRAGAGLRHELVRTGSVKSVISLSGGALRLPGTMVGTTAWVLGSPTTDVRPVLMVNGAAVDTLDEIIDSVTTWRDHPETFQPVPGFTATVPVLELLAADVGLDPALATAVPIDPDQALHAAATALEALTAAGRELSACPPVPGLHLQPGRTPLVNLTDLAEVARPPHLRRDEVSDHGPHPYVTGVTDAALRVAGRLTDLPAAAVVTEPGDVVLSTTGRISAVVDHTGGHVLGSSVWRIRPTSELAAHPDVLALLLNSSRISAQTSGTTVQRLRHPKDITIACPDPDTIETLQQWLDATSHTRHQANAYLTAASAAEQAVIDALDAGATAGTDPSGQVGG